MKNICSIVLLVLLVVSPCCVQGQLWKQYADSAKANAERELFDNSIDLYKKALHELKKDSMATLTYADVINELAEVYGERDEYEKVEPLFIEVRQIKAGILGTSHFDYATTCHNLGRLYMAMAQYNKAVVFYLESKDVTERSVGRENSDYAITCNNLANVYSNMGQFVKSESLHLEIKQIRERILGKEHPDYASSCNNLGALYVTMGLYDKAEPLYLEAKMIRDSLRSKDQSRRIQSEYANTCNNLAILYSNIGEYEKAESLHLEAKLVRDKTFGKENSIYAQSCSNLGSLYTYMGQYQKAESLLLESRQIREKVVGKDDLEYAQTCHNLGVFYVDRRQYEKAEQFYLETKRIRENVYGKEHPIYANTCNTLAALYRIIGQYAKAEELYLEARQIRSKVLGTEHPDYKSTCQGQAILYWNMKDSEKAIGLFTEAFMVQNTLQKKVFEFTNEAEKQSYLKKYSDDQDYFFSFATSSGLHSRQGLSYDISLAQRNLILSSSRQLRKTIYASTDTCLKNRYAAWVDIKEQLAFWYTKSGANRVQNIAELESKAEDLEKALTRQSTLFKNQNRDNLVTWKDIHQELKPNEAAIEFVKFDYYNGRRMTDSVFYIALMIRPDIDHPLLIPVFESRQLEKLFGSGSSLATVSSLYRFNDKRESLYNLLWRPIEKHLDGIKRVYYAPAGNLFRIAFAALPVNDHEVLSDKYQLIQLNTTALVLNQHNHTIGVDDEIILYGGIQYEADSSALKQASVAYEKKAEPTVLFSADDTRGNTWRFLPGTGKETGAIRSLGKQKGYSIKNYNDVKASEESVKALNGNNSPAVLHIATHGFFFPDPMRVESNKGERSVDGSPFKFSANPLFRSGLLFAGANNAWSGKQFEGLEDGILTAYEVSNLYLPNTKLVVLSACETGLGDIQGNEGVYGLQRAFKIAGVENLVMSLWKVPDNTTAEFMQEFYKNIFNKQSISDAFNHAQMVMKNKYREQPYKWAAWILVR